MLMAQTQVQLLISFETLTEAVLALELKDQIQLRTLLEQAIAHRAKPASPEEALMVRGVRFP